MKRQRPDTEDQEGNSVLRWEEFYTRAIALRNKGEESIEKEECYGFPEDGDPTLDAACEALSDALQNASKARVEKDTAEVKQALDNLRKAYDEATKSNTVMVHYIDVEPPSAPYSPLKKPNLRGILLARSWMKELINGLRDQSLFPQLLVVGDPGSGKSVALVGYLLFYLIAQGERTILQSERRNGRLGFVFDDRGVHQVFAGDPDSYDDGKPCCLLVSADGKNVSPLDDFEFCDRTVVVTSPNLKAKVDLENWQKQTSARQYIAPPPSCLEVVYLLSKIENYDSYLVYWMYREWTRDFRRCRIDCQEATSHLEKGTLSQWYRTKQQDITDLVERMLSGSLGPDEAHQIRDTRTNLRIPSALVTMESLGEQIHRQNIKFMTPRIAQVVADVQETQRWTKIVGRP